MTTISAGMILQRLILMALAVLIFQTLLFAAAEERPAYIHPEIFHARQLRKKIVMPGAVNLNYAGLSELKTLPGVNQSVALKILRLRSNQSISSMNDLYNLSGIQPQQLSQLINAIDGKVSFATNLRR